MGRILVVDDDNSVLELLKTVLVHAGFEVRTAADGREALERLDATCDVLLCDKNLPLVAGTQVVLEARERFPHLTTVLMTAAPEALALSSLGLDGYLAKPFRSFSLVTHTIKAARQRRAAASGQRVEGELPPPRPSASTGPKDPRKQ
ncbi:MAG: response regulator [Myxococcaceae bacterium]